MKEGVGGFFFAPMELPSWSFRWAWAGHAARDVVFKRRSNAASFSEGPGCGDSGASLKLVSSSAKAVVVALRIYLTQGRPA